LKTHFVKWLTGERGYAATIEVARSRTSMRSDALLRFWDSSEIYSSSSKKRTTS